jgi:hypothetical protein
MIARVYASRSTFALAPSAAWAAALAGVLSVALALAPSASAQRAAYGYELTPKRFQRGVFKPAAGKLELAPGGSGEPSFEQDALRCRADDAPWSTEAIEGRRLPQQFTLEAIVAVLQPKKNAAFVTASSDGGGGERGFILGIRDRRFSLTVAGESKNRLWYTNAEADFELGRWYHVVGVYDGESSTLYVNGERVARDDRVNGQVLYAEQHVLQVGGGAAGRDATDGGTGIDALLAEVSVYDRAFDERSVQKLFQGARIDRRAPVAGRSEDQQEAQPEGLPTLDALQPRIETAIDRGIQRLLERQNRDGSWSLEAVRYRNGMTALAAFTLLECGVRPDHPAILAAVDFLDLELPTMTYSAGCELLLRGSLGEGQRERVQAIVDLLLDWENDRTPGAWAYPDGRPDLSCTQFVCLGFQAAAAIGVDVGDDVWRRIAKRAVASYQPFEKRVRVPGERTDAPREIAGFVYTPEEDEVETGSMTTAGIGVLALAERFAPTAPASERREWEEAREKALGWLAWTFSVRSNPGRPRSLHYYLYGLERIGAWLELDEIGGRPWYLEGAFALVEDQQKDGDWGIDEADTCFALLFLARATADGPSTGRAYGGGIVAEPQRLERATSRSSATAPGHSTCTCSGWARRTPRRRRRCAACGGSSTTRSLRISKERAGLGPCATRIQPP